MPVRCTTDFSSGSQSSRRGPQRAWSALPSARSSGSAIIGDMADGLDDFIDDWLRLNLPKEFDQLSGAEQVAIAKETLFRFRNAIAEPRENPEAAARFPRRHASPDLPQLIGEVVLAAAWAEDAAGTLLQAVTGDWTVRANGFDDTSGSLLRHLARVAPAELVERLKVAMDLRHFVVHGFWVDGSFIPHEATGRTYDFVSMKRSWRTEAPEREMKAFTKNALTWLAQEFWEIEDELEALHSQVLFDRNEDNAPRME